MATYRNSRINTYVRIQYIYSSINKNSGGLYLMFMVRCMAVKVLLYCMCVYGKLYNYYVCIYVIIILVQVLACVDIEQ